MDLNTSIRMAVDTGKTVLGSEKAKKFALLGEAKAIIVAKNCPAAVKQDITHYASMSGVPIIEFKGSNMALGVVCGKPFSVSALSIVEAGNSDILKLVQGKG
ncbi:MAG: 50S ribosomal protein L30e [Candidatus Micrarchaeota archaeon]